MKGSDYWGHWRVPYNFYDFRVDVFPLDHYLNGSDLADESPEGWVTFIILELPNKDLQSCHIEECHSNLVVMLLKRKHKLGFIVCHFIFVLKSAFRNHIAYFPIHTLCHTFALLFFRNFPFFELSWSLCLLNYRNLKAILDHDLKVFIKYFLRKTNMKFLASTHPI
jgi:hypothetical protein